MRLIKSGFEILEQGQGLDNIYKQIELAGRTCYKSQDKITEGSAKKFVDMMIKSGHGAMLEHGTIYLKWKQNVIGYSYDGCKDMPDYDNNPLQHYQYNKYSKYKHIPNILEECYVTTNLRVLVENDWMKDLKYLCEPTEYHDKRITVKWDIDRVTGESFLRHRVFSFARESTRYCNFSKDKFGNELTCVVPSWCEEIELSKYGENHIIDRSNQPESTFMAAMNTAETAYFTLLDRGWKPQMARQVLPFALYSPLVMTGFIEDWKHFFELRCDKAAHPDAQYLANTLKQKFIEKKYI